MCFSGRADLGRVSRSATSLYLRNRVSWSRQTGPLQPVGYLINFGHKGELQWKRFILSDLHEKAEGNANPR